MQEIKKRRIVIASVLKPVDDTRMFDKVGRSLAAGHEVYVIGFEGEKNGKVYGVTQLSIGTFSRISLKRFFASWKIFRMILRLRPDLLIVCTHELLFPAALAKLSIGCRIWYDLQENYTRNILYTKAFPVILRPLLAAWVRLKELLTYSFVDRYLLAEASYADEMKFVARKSVVIENKFRREMLAAGQSAPLSKNQKQLIFSGTISESTGVYIAIELAAALHAIDPEISLVVIGHCPLERDYSDLQGISKKNPFIQWKGERRPVPHNKILLELMRSGFGIISYPPNPATRGSIPTKLFEYLGIRLPFLLINHPKWAAISDRHCAAVHFDATHISPDRIYFQMMNNRFYVSDPQDVYWESEERKLLQLLQKS
jgi:glycosyltransferase involved in cell wall biosynthesis